MHLAELLAAAGGQGGVLGLDSDHPERTAAPRPAGPTSAAKLAVAGTAAVLAGALAAGAVMAIRRTVALAARRAVR